MTQFYFEVCNDPGSEESIDSFVIVSKEFWDEHGHLDDSVSEQLEGILPANFYELCEAVYEFDGSVEEGRQALLELGFIEKTLTDTF